MSTIKVTNIKSGSTDDGGIAIDATGHVQVDGVQMPTAGALSGRRININGAMQIAQRGTSYSLAHDDSDTSVYTTCDSYQFVLSGADSYDCTITQSSDAPDGFANSLKVETGTAEATVDADELFYIQHKIEGQDVQMLQNGSSNAKKVTLSFYVKTSQAGTYGVVLYKADNTARVISATYTTTTTDWEFVELTFAGDTAGGGIDDDNGEGFRIVWSLVAGSQYTSTDTSSWTNYTANEWAYGHTQNALATTASATWQLSGVQLELGDKATPFEHRSFGDELAKCQRYYQRGGETLYSYYAGSATLESYAQFAVEMRATPSSASLISTTYLGSGFSSTTTLVDKYGLRINYPSSAAGYSGARVVFDANAEL